MDLGSLKGCVPLSTPAQFRMGSYACDLCSRPEGHGRVVDWNARKSNGFHTSGFRTEGY
jgi:hypothetical protein